MRQGPMAHQPWIEGRTGAGDQVKIIPMAQRKHAGLFGEVAIRAMQDALYERVIDRCWEEVRDVFERPDVKEAEAVIMHAIAEAFAPGGRKKRRGRRK